MANPKHNPFIPEFNSQNPATWLKPDEPLMAAGLDWSWCYVWFKDVVGFPGYKVEWHGTVWSNWKRSSLGFGKGSRTEPGGPWKIRKPGLMTSGYLFVPVFRKGGDRYGHDFAIHSLVLLCFVGACPDGFECRHLDGNKFNNCLSNLAWGTCQENADDRIRHGTVLRGAERPNAKLTDQLVDEIRLSYADGESIASLARRHGVTGGTISFAVSGKTWKHTETAAEAKKSWIPGRKVGSESHKAILVEEDVAEMRRLYVGGSTTIELAGKYGVSQATAWKAIRGKKWAHVPGAVGPRQKG